MTDNYRKRGCLSTVQKEDDEYEPFFGKAGTFTVDEEDSSTSLGHSVSTISDYIAAGYIPEKPCFICRLRSPVDTLMELCSCSAIQVHKECWECWLATSGDDSCRLCGRPYHVERHVTYTPLHGFWVWFLSHASKFHLVTMLLLATSALTEVVLVGAYTAAVVQSFQKGLPLEGWRAGARLLRRLLQETRAPCWLVLLVAGVLLVQAPLLYKLCSNYFSSFRSWYLGTITVTLLRLPHHENAPPPVHNQ